MRHEELIDAVDATGRLDPRNRIAEVPVRRMATRSRPARRQPDSTGLDAIGSAAADRPIDAAGQRLLHVADMHETAGDGPSQRRDAPVPFQPVPVA